MTLRADALLFDLGRVVIDFDFERALTAWQAHSRLPPERLRELFAHDEPFRRFEVGALGREDYYAYLRDLLALEGELERIEAGWNATLIGEITETLQLVDAVRDRIPCHAITNTNPSHLAAIHQSHPGLLPRFRRVFASHEIGCRKPEPQAFRHVLRELGVAPERTLLFDDLQANVDGARRCGMQAVLVRGPQDVREALRALGLL